MSEKWRPEVNVKKGIVINPNGCPVYNFPRPNSEVVDTKAYGSQIEYATKEHLQGLIYDREFYIVNGDDYLGYIKKDDVKELDGDNHFCYLTYPEMSYLIHLLEYADEELYVYSANYLGRFGIKLEEVNEFINNLKGKIQKGDDKT